MHLIIWDVVMLSKLTAVTTLALVLSILAPLSQAEEQKPSPAFVIREALSPTIQKYTSAEIVVVSDEYTESACGLEATSKELFTQFTEEIKKSGKFSIASSDSKSGLLIVLTITTLGYKSPMLTPNWARCQYYSDHNELGTLALNMRLEDKETGNSLGKFDISYHTDTSRGELGTTMRQVAAFSKQLASQLQP